MNPLSRQGLRLAFATAAVLVVLVMVFSIASLWLTSATAELHQQRRAVDRLQARWLAQAASAQLTQTWHATTPRPEFSTEETPLVLPLAGDLTATWTITTRQLKSASNRSFVEINVSRKGPPAAAVGYRLSWLPPSP